MELKKKLAESMEMVRGAKGRRKQSSRTSGRRRRHLLLEPLCDRRVLAAITGTVFDDVDDSSRRDAAEVGLQNRLVYLDSNGDGRLGAGEAYQLTGADGRFAFEDLGLGDYTVRLFNGATVQRQTVPVQPQWAETIELEESQISALSADESQLYLLQGTTLVQFDLETGEQVSLEMPAPVASLHPLPDGRLVALGEPDAGIEGDAAWLISFDSVSVTPANFGLKAGETGWASMAIDGTGNGVLVAASAEGDATILRQVIASNGTVQAIETGSNVAAGATAISGPDATVSLIAVPNESGLQVTQWSNSTATPVAGSTTAVADAVALLAFDEAAGLAVVESANGGLLVLDAAANLGILHQFDDLENPVALDGNREKLYAVSDSGELVIQDLVDSDVRQNLTLNEAIVGGMALIEGGRAAVVAHAGHLRRLRLDRPAEHRVALRQGQASADIFFGLYVDGENQAPSSGDLNLQLNEDTTLNLASPGLLQAAADPNAGDRFIVLPATDPSLGSAQIDPAGPLTYEPNENVNGPDSFDIVLHDGHSISEPITVHIDIQPVDDPVGPVIVIGPNGTVDPIVPENISPDVPFGTINIINPDVGEVVDIQVAEDHRFVIYNYQLFLVNGFQLDYETEPVIDLLVAYTDEETGLPAGLDTIQLQVGDSPEPIIGVYVDGLRTIMEGDYTGESTAPEMQVATVYVSDLDERGTYEISASDSRFEVVDGQLRIVPDSTFDFEEEPEIELTLHVSEVGGPFDYSETVTVAIGDVNELPTEASFASTTIEERVAGATVGDVSVDDPDQPSTVRFSVDDSRFEFEGATLKLRDGVFVERSQQEQIQLTLTVADYADVEFVQTIDVTLEVLENANPFHNGEINADVNGDNVVEPLDALMIINYLNRFGPGPIEEAVNSGNAEYFYDVNDDGLVTPLDALLVINQLNQNQTPTNPIVGGESEQERAVPPMEPEGEGGERSLLPLDPARSAPNRAEAAGTIASAVEAEPRHRAYDLAVESLSRDDDEEADRRDPLESPLLAANLLKRR